MDRFAAGCQFDDDQQEHDDHPIEVQVLTLRRSLKPAVTGDFTRTASKELRYDDDEIWLSHSDRCSDFDCDRLADGLCRDAQRARPDRRHEHHRADDHHDETRPGGDPFVILDHDDDDILSAAKGWARQGAPSPCCGRIVL
jgi:hypothetical protein